MEVQMKPPLANNLWELVDLPPNKRVLLNRWVFSYASGAKLDDMLSATGIPPKKKLD